MTQKHLINTQVVQLEVDTSQDAYAMQHRISKWVQQELNPLIEKLFDRLIPEDRMLRLDQVVLDVGSITLENNNLTIVGDRILKLLEEVLVQQMHQAYATPQKENVSKLGQDFFFKTSHPLYDNEDHKYLRESSGIPKSYKGAIESKENRIEVTHQSLRQHYFDIWIYWLEKGSLPAYTLPPKNDWMTLVLETMALDLEAILLLTEKIRKNTNILERLVVQHTEKELQTIAELYTGFSQRELSIFIEEIKNMIIDLNAKNPEITPLPLRDVEIWIWKQILISTIQKREKKDSTSLCIMVMQDIISFQRLPGTTKRRFLSKIKAIKTNKKAYPILHSFLKDIIVDLESELEKEIQFEKNQPIKESELRNVSDSNDRFFDTENVKQLLDLQEEEELSSPQYFNNAGMVLLHPFLGSFFKKLGVLRM